MQIRKRNGLNVSNGSFCCSNAIKTVLDNETVPGHLGNGRDMGEEHERNDDKYRPLPA